MLGKLPYDPLSVVCSYFTPDEVGQLRTLSKSMNVSLGRYYNKFWYKLFRSHFPDECDEYDEELNYRNMCINKGTLFIPKIKKMDGVDTIFKYRRAFFNKYKDRCLRVVAVYAVILFGANYGNKYHIVEYNPHKKTGTCVNINKMLISAFYNLPCDTSFFHLTKTAFDFGTHAEFKGEEISNFNSSVDQTFMQLKYGDETGIDFTKKMTKTGEKECVCELIRDFDNCKCDSEGNYKNDINKILDMGTFYNEMKYVKVTKHLEGECDHNCPKDCANQRWSEYDMDPECLGVGSKFNNLIFDFANHDLVCTEVDDEYLFEITNIKREGFKHAAINYDYYRGHRDEKTVEKDYYGGGRYLNEVWVKVEWEREKWIEVKSSYVGLDLL